VRELVDSLFAGSMPELLTYLEAEPAPAAAAATVPTPANSTLDAALL